PDLADSVIVLDFSAPPRGGGIRLLGPANQLLTYDADQQGGGFGRGDGKANRYYVTNWTRTDQSLTWTVRSNRTGHYNVTALYAKGTGTGRYQLEIDDWRVEHAVSTEAKSDRTFSEPLGAIDLPSGIHTIRLRALDIKGGELFRPLELQLR